MSTDQLANPLALAEKVAEAMTPMGGTWTARQREYRIDETAEIVNEHGDAVWMEILGRSSYTRAADHGKIVFSTSYDQELREHYPHDVARVETRVSDTRPVEAMAKTVVRKIVPTLVEANRVARERRDAFEVSRAANQAVAERLAEVLGDERPVERLNDRHSDRFLVGYRHQAQAEVTSSGVRLELHDLPAEMAGRILAEVAAYRAEQAPQ